MATVIPFRAILYNPLRVSGDDVFAPPYDIISQELKERLYRQSPYNVVRIDFGMDQPGDTGQDNRYTRAKDHLHKWLEEGILVRNEQPSFYGYEIEYQHRGLRKTLRGLLALVHIEELGEGVFPHEATYSKPKADRLSLMRTCEANISPIYSLYHSLDKVTSDILSSLSGAPYISGKDADGALHKLHKISDKSSIDLITREFAGRPIFIADGHHRYEVALEYKREMESQERGRKSGATGENEFRPWEYVLMFLANIADEGITILPTHRMIKGVSRSADIVEALGTHFTIDRISGETDITSAVAEKGSNSFGLYLGAEEYWFLLQYKGGGLEEVHPAMKDLDVIILHELILKRDLGITDFGYEMDIGEALQKVHRGEFDAVFFLNPTRVTDVERVAVVNLRMPPKSTYFYPKLLTGIAINSFNHL